MFYGLCPSPGDSTSLQIRVKPTEGASYSLKINGNPVYKLQNMLYAHLSAKAGDLGLTLKPPLPPLRTSVTQVRPRSDKTLVPPHTYRPLSPKADHICEGFAVRRRDTVSFARAYNNFYSGQQETYSPSLAADNSSYSRLRSAMRIRKSHLLLPLERDEKANSCHPGQSKRSGASHTLWASGGSPALTTPRARFHISFTFIAFRCFQANVS